MPKSYLHPDTIEAVRQAVNIVEVVSEHVPLSKKGKDYFGICPFHQEKTASFSVNPRNGLYYCFGCGAAGNAITFLMELQKHSFQEVVLELAKRYQIEVRTLDREQEKKLQARLSHQDRLHEILASATSFYEHALRQPIGQAAQDYLLRQRHLQEETIQQFRLGYAPADWQGLYTYLVEQKGYSATLVAEAGLIVRRQTGNGYYDRFRNRIMIPIIDVQGRVVGFGGRTLSDTEPKYINSPETLIFKKGQLLFGLDKARQAIGQKKQAIVVEGYFDVMVLHQAGFTQAVASLGTALSKAQINLLLNYLKDTHSKQLKHTPSKQIILNFDADMAGRRAADRAIGEAADFVYNGDLQLYILTLPSGKDAADFLTEDGESLETQCNRYQTLLDQAPLWLDWQIHTIVQQYDLDKNDQFQQAEESLVLLLSKIRDQSLKANYVRYCAKLLGRHDSRLIVRLEESLWQKVQGQRWQAQAPRWQRPGDYNLRQAAEEKLLRLYLHHGESRPLIQQELQARKFEFSFSHHRRLWDEISVTEKELTDTNDLVITLCKRLDKLKEDTEDNSPISLITPLLFLDELAAIDLQRPDALIKAAFATLEMLDVQKECRWTLNCLKENVNWFLSQYSEKFSSQYSEKGLESLLININTDNDNIHNVDDNSVVESEQSELGRLLKNIKRLQNDHYHLCNYQQKLQQQRRLGV